jgi:hypothetical protein
MNLICVQVQVVLPVCLGSWPSWSGWPDVTFLWVAITFYLFHVRRPLWWEDGSVICSAMTRVQVIMRPTVCQPVCFGAGPPVGPMTIEKFPLITSRHISHRKHRSSLSLRQRRNRRSSVAKSGHYLATAAVYRIITYWRLAYFCSLRGRCLAPGVYMYVTVLQFYYNVQTICV